jgi:hypothetical protein
MSDWKVQLKSDILLQTKENMASPAKKMERVQKPIRFRALRSDASIGSAERVIATKFGLPEGSVKLVHRSGRKVRSDSRVGAFLRAWGI